MQTTQQWTLSSRSGHHQALCALMNRAGSRRFTGQVLTDSHPWHSLPTQDAPMPACLRLVREGTALFLLNERPETLEYVTVSRWGTQTIADEAFALKATPPIGYRAVPPNAAIKIEDYDGFYDPYFSLGLELVIQGPILGTRTFTVPPCQGGVGDTVLLSQTRPH